MKGQTVFQNAKIRERERSIYYILDGGPAEVDEFTQGETWTKRVTLNVYHSKNDKAYVAQVRKSAVREDGSVYVERYSPFEDMAVVTVERCARFNMKSFDAFASMAVRLAETIANNEGDISKAAVILREGRDFASAKA